MRAKLRTDLRDLVPKSRSPARYYIDQFVQDHAGRSLEVLNVVVGHVVLRLPRPYYMHHGDVIVHVTALSVPHEWLLQDITKDEFCAWKKTLPIGRGGA